MRSTLHVRTTGFYCKACPKVVEKALRSERGVLDVMAVHTMGLTSILYDSEVIDADSLCARIRSAGFGAAPYCPQDVLSCGDEELQTDQHKGTGEGHDA